MSIEKQLSSLSSSKEIFEKTAPYYGEYLSNCRYREKLSYRDTTSPNLITKRKRQRNILWFNPPYSKTVKTKIGKIFLQLIKKHLPKEHKFHKIFNRNTMKLSYSCMLNIKKEKQTYIIDKFYDIHHQKDHHIANKKKTSL